jgi:hypothetical protein
MRVLASDDSSPRLIKLLDEFDICGPNGRHKCLVLELLGPCVPGVIESRFPDGLIAKLLHFEPSKRSSAKEILSDPWFSTYQ